MDDKVALQLVMYYLHRVNRISTRVGAVCRHGNIQPPTPPKALAYRDVRVNGNTDLHLCMSFEPQPGFVERAYILHVWVSESDTPHLRRQKPSSCAYSSASLYCRDRIPTPQDLDTYSHERSVATAITRCNARALDSFIWQLDHVLKWMESVERSLQRHVEHTKEQYKRGSRYRRIQKALDHIEDELTVQSL